MSINSLNVRESVCPRARDDGRGVEHDVHDTWLTGAMVARTCGAHQGAEVTSAWFEVSGDLQSANEERDDVDEVRQRRGSRGEVSDDGAARTKASWWHWYHVWQSCSTRGQSALEGSRCGSQSRIPSSTLGLPLQSGKGGECASMSDKDIPDLQTREIPR